jgi:hypothetical protein
MPIFRIPLQNKFQNNLRQDSYKEVNPMYKFKFLMILSTLVLASLACGLNINIPITTDIKTGPIVTDEIQIPFLEVPDTTAAVTLEFGAGELNLSPGAVGYLINGEASYNVEDLKPDISINDEAIRIETGNLEITGIPSFKERVKNKWNLSLSSSPIDLTIKAGAYVGDFEFGNLALVNLHIADGASEVEMNFAQPNQIEMQSLRYETGASNITLRNLANANFSTMIFESGAGNYTLDFSGQLQRDATVFIETGLSTLTILVPEDMHVKATVEGGLTNITTREPWEQSGNMYTIAGEGPTLTISIQMNAGNLILKNP